MKNTLNDELFFHTYFGDLAGVKAALAAGANPSATAKRDWLRLNHCYHKWLELGSPPQEKERLFEKQWVDNPEAYHPSTDTVLMLAVFPPRKNEAIVSALLKAGADPNYANSEGTTALHYAALHSTSMVRLLLESGANPNAAYILGTPLHTAARRGDPELVRLLLDAGADPNDTTGHTKTSPLLLAASHGDLLSAGTEKVRVDRDPQQWHAVIELLLAAGSDPNFMAPESTSSRAATAMGFAAEYQDMALMERLEAAGACPTMGLANACNTDNPALVKRLLAAGADTELPDGLGNTPLMNAAGNGQLEMVEALLQTGASIGNARKEDGVDALLRAVCTNQVEIVARLIHTGLSVNKVYEFRDKTRDTLLHSAAQRGHAEMTALLLQLGANPSLQDNKGKTALDYARQLEETYQKMTERDRPTPRRNPILDDIIWEHALTMAENERRVNMGRIACRELLETAMQLAA